MRYLHPEWDRTCADCKAYLHDSDTGAVTKRLGLPVLRPKGSPLPCAGCPKIPDDAPAKSPEHALEISDRSRAVLQHYAECRAVSHFPDDPIVRRNAALIREFMDDMERSESRAWLRKLTMMRGI